MPHGLALPDTPERIRQREANRRSYEKHKENRQKKCREYQQKRHDENPEHVKALAKEWLENNRDRSNAVRAARRKVKPDKTYKFSPEKRRAYYESKRDEFRRRYREWSARNPEKEAARAAKRRAAKIKATPRWADQEKIKFFYSMACEMTKKHGVQYEVDHIIPLRGKNVCGLHCEQNLQVITAEENMRKGNKCL
jgi:hypothetical protein